MTALAFVAPERLGGVNSFYGRGGTHCRNESLVCEIKAGPSTVCTASARPASTLYSLWDGCGESRPARLLRTAWPSGIRHGGEQVVRRAGWMTTTAVNRTLGCEKVPIPRFDRSRGGKVFRKPTGGKSAAQSDYFSRGSVRPVPPHSGSLLPAPTLGQLGAKTPHSFEHLT